VGEPRFGLGFDAHPRDPSRELWLGGLLFDGQPGLAGHSDGDAVCHALADALLGAAALADVGVHFPEGDPAIAGISGADLLGRTVGLVGAQGLAPASCDVTVICASPPISPRRDEMRARLSEILGIAVDRVSVKATRPEGLGLAGDGAGCLALAVLS
jgi:2-C-methyl-D-erythritol 4-phosphate cytidylyltransferase/2-C-methyl-D-erythritol 2,4-cyclodiphosphate synthase